ncbi:hypothetical protein D9M71_838830 [compost metagenome]
MRFRVLGALARQLQPDRLQQFIGSLTTEALIQTRQIINPQQQQITRAGLFGVAHPCVQLHLEITTVRQSCQVVLIRLDPQLFTAFGLLLKQSL